MPERKPHILIDGLAAPEEFGSRQRGRKPAIPSKDRATHGTSLAEQYSRVLESFRNQREAGGEPITDEIGIYLEIIGEPDFELPLDSLDTSRDFKLRSCRKVDGREVAVVFVPEDRRDAFHRKLAEYLNPDKDSQKGNPRNYALVNAISEIKIADLRSFWTDAPSLFPEDPNQWVWWELWLKKKPADEDPIQVAQQLSERISGQLGNTALSFFDSFVVLIKASVDQLERAPELIANLAEVRRAKETPTVLIESSAKDQHNWIDDLNDRLQVSADATTAVAILDSGVNHNHPLLGRVCTEERSERWDPEWPPFDEYDPANPHRPFNDHGSRQAGLAAFGDLQEAVVSAEPITLNHWIESARILPPSGTNDPELYGAITVQTAAKLEIESPELRRVYSLAITAEPEREGGQPSSWSAELDQFAAGVEDGEQRLFVISAGNNPDINPTVDCWEQLHLAQIEDPAQAWNALTVGAYTERTTNDDPEFDGWAPLAECGDVAPSSRSSVNWAWRKHAPYKPDVVEEGGNRLLSPERTEVSDADVIALLTTSGRAAGQLFESTADTSASCALVSREAAMLMAEYPALWPETIRGLLVHSAEWTPKMFARFGILFEQHSPKLAKEIMLRSVGYGVPDLERARYSANHVLTLIGQDTLRPFTKAEGAADYIDPKLGEMQLYQLPWPAEVLRQLPPELEVKLRVTLSYFVEPNPGRRGYRRRYSYPSHGLRFAVIRPGQSLENFRAWVNQKANDETEDYTGPEGEGEGWRFGPQLRTRGSLHSDAWTGSAADLADMQTVAVYPVGGWWKHRTALHRWQNPVRYSLIITIDVPDESVDIYSVVENMIESQVEVPV